jgi:hypothetical protein
MGNLLDVTIGEGQQGFIYDIAMDNEYTFVGVSRSHRLCAESLDRESLVAG